MSVNINPFSFVLQTLLLVSKCYGQPDFKMSANGEGLHRSFDLEISNYMLNSSALLKWDITPDFYVDVFELERYSNCFITLL
jgi:hypothetical protein